MDQLNPGSIEYAEQQKALAIRWAAEAEAEGVDFIAVRMIGFSGDLDRSVHICATDGINGVLRRMAFPTGAAGWQIVVEDAADELARCAAEVADGYAEVGLHISENEEA